MQIIKKACPIKESIIKHINQIANKYTSSCESHIIKIETEIIIDENIILTPIE